VGDRADGGVGCDSAGVFPQEGLAELIAFLVPSPGGTAQSGNVAAPIRLAMIDALTRKFTCTLAQYCFLSKHLGAGSAAASRAACPTLSFEAEVWK
jgi:hypothetical protein